MKILLTGATGFIGHVLLKELFLAGHDLVICSRNTKRARQKLGIPATFIEWDPLEGPPDLQAHPDINAVINMMGENLASGRWTKRRKKSIYDSRVVGTRHLCQALDRDLRQSLDVFIGFSAIGFYPSGNDQPLDESASAGDGFLAKVCKDWEQSSQSLQKCQRQVSLRVGAVLGYGGGAVAKLLPPFRAGLGGPVGDGTQWMSWIHRDDLVALCLTVLTEKAWQGPINAVSPAPVQNAQLSRTLGELLGKPAVLPVPAQALKGLLGEMSQVILASQYIQAAKLQESSFKFRFPDIRSALAEAIGLAPVGRHGEYEVCERFEDYLFVDKPTSELFDFFCYPYNLERITPPLLQFKISRIDEGDVREGMIIDYRLKLHGVPLQWQTLIKEWQPNQQFVDFQLKGPYKIWHHRHQFFPVAGGTLMVDRVDYRLPLGTIGHFMGKPLVRRDVDKIFAYRRETIQNIFGSGNH